MTRKEFNHEWKCLDDKIEKSKSIAYLALISMCLMLIGIFISPVLFFFGGVGMIICGGYLGIVQGKMKDLERAWKLSPHKKIKHYPNI